MKRLGIIGGFGPEATAQFYLKLVDACRKAHHGTQPHILLRNVSVPSKMEHDALLHGKNIDSFIPFLTRAAIDLEKSNVDVIVMPCNTLHIHEKEIRRATSVPFVSIIDAAISHLRKLRVSKVGILGSRLTNKHNLFKQRAQDITFVTVPPPIQTAINEGLDRFVVEGDSTLLTKALRKACRSLKRNGVRNILVACTDFTDVMQPIKNITFHDTLDILVEATVNML